MNHKLLRKEQKIYLQYFRPLRKIAKNNLSYLSVCSSEWKNSAPLERFPRNLIFEIFFKIQC